MEENKMARLLPADCLNEIFENLEEDKITLHSCLLVNRLWCEVSVGILWKDIWSFIYSAPYHAHNRRKESAVLSTLIACLPSESKELLRKNKIFIATPTSKTLFNYATFCKVLSINKIGRMVSDTFKTNPKCGSHHLMITEEIIKLFMNQISSLKKLTYKLGSFHLDVPESIPFTS